MIPATISTGYLQARYIHENPHGFGFSVVRLNGLNRIGIIVVVVSECGRCLADFVPSDDAYFSIIDLAELAVLLSRVRDACFDNVPSSPPEPPAPFFSGIDALIDKALRK